MLALEIATGLTAPPSPKKRVKNSSKLQLPQSSPGRCLGGKRGIACSASSVHTHHAYNLCLSEMRHYRDDGKMVLVMSQQHGEVQEAEYPIPMSQDTAQILEADDDDVLASYAEAAAKLVCPAPMEQTEDFYNYSPRRLYMYDDVAHEEFDMETYTADDNSGEYSPLHMEKMYSTPTTSHSPPTSDVRHPEDAVLDKSSYLTSTNGTNVPLKPDPDAGVRVHNGARPAELSCEAPQQQPRGFFDANPTAPPAPPAIEYSPGTNSDVLVGSPMDMTPHQLSPNDRGQPTPERQLHEDLDDGNVAASFARAVSHSTFASALPGHSRDRSGSSPMHRSRQRDASALAQIARIDTNSLSSYSVPTLRKIAKNIGLCNLHGLSKSELVVQLVSEVVLANMSLGLDAPTISQGVISGDFDDTESRYSSSPGKESWTDGIALSADVPTEASWNHLQEDLHSLKDRGHVYYSHGASVGQHSTDSSSDERLPSDEEFDVDSDFESLSKLTMSELQQLCEEAGIRGWARMRKFEIVSALLMSAYEL